jgi:hypothetical protein
MANNLDINLDGLTDSVNRFIKTLDLLDKRFEAFGQSAVLANAFGTPKQVDSYISSINKLDTVASNTFKNLIREITRLQRVSREYNASGGNGFSGIVNELLQVSRKLGEIGDTAFDVKRVTNLFELVAIINTKLIGLKPMTASDIESLRGLSDLYTMIGKSVNRMLTAINDLQAVDYNKIKVFTDVISFIQVGIGNAINKGAKVAAIDDFRRIGTAIANLAQAIPKIINELENIPKTGILYTFTKQRRQLVNFFNTIGFILGGVSKAIKKTKLTGDEAKGIRQMATALLDISKAIPQLIRDSQQLPALGGWFRAFTKQRRDFGAFLGSIRFIINQLGKIKVKPGSIEGLNAITTFMDKIKTFDWRGIDYEGMDEFTKRTEKSFSRFKGLSGFKMPSVQKGQRRNSYGRDDAGVIRSAQTFVGQMPNALTIAKGVLIRDAVQFAIRNLGQFANYMINYRTILLRSIKTIGDTLRQGGQTLTNIGQGLLTTFSPTRLFQSRGLELATEFQAISTQLEIFGNLTKEQTASMQALANEIGIQFPLSANDALSSILDLIKAGRSLEEIEFLLPASASLASLSESGNLDMVTKFLINAGMNVRQVTDDIAGGFSSVAAVTDVIFQAANATTASVDGLIEGMREGILAGKALGLTFEETAAALTIFEDAEIRGSEAGTALRTFEAALSKMEGSTFEEKLQNAFALTDDRKFGDTRAVQALRIFRDAEARGGIQGIIKQFEGMDSAQEAAAKSMENLRGNILQLQGSFETAQQMAFEPLLDRVFIPLVKLARLVVDGFIGLDESLRETLVTSTLLTGALGALSGAVLLTTGLVMRLSGGFTSLVASAGLFILKAPLMIFSISSIGAATITALSSVALLSGAILAIGATVTKFYRAVENNIGGAGDAFGRFAKSVQEFFGAIGKSFRGLQVAFDVIFGKDVMDDRVAEGERLSGFFDTMTKRINEASESIKKFDPFKFLVKMKPIINQLREGFSDISAGVLGVISGDDELSKQGARGLGTYGRIMSRALGDIFGVNMENAIYAFDTGQIFEGVSRTVKNLINGFDTAVENNKDKIVEIAETLFGFLNPFNKISGFFRILGLDSLADTLKSVGDTITDVLGGIAGSILDIFSGKSLPDAINDNFAGSVLLKSILKQVSSAFSSINSEFQRLWGGINLSNIIRDIVSSFSQIFTNSEKPINERIAEFLRSIVSGLSQTIAKLPEFLFSSISGLIKSGLATLGKLFGGQTETLLADTSKSVFRLIGRFFGILFTEIPKAVVSLIKNVFDVLQRTFSDESGNFSIIEFGRTIVKGIYSIASSIVASFGDLFLGFGEGAGSFFMAGIGRAIRNFSPGEFVKTLVIAFSDMLILFDRLILEAVGVNTEGLRSAFAGIAEVVGNFLVPIFDIFGNALRSILYFFDALTGKSDEARVYALALAAGVIYLTKQFKPFQNALKAIGITIGQFFPVFRNAFQRVSNLFSGLKKRIESVFPKGAGEKSPFVVAITNGISSATKQLKLFYYNAISSTSLTLKGIFKQFVKGVSSATFSAITNFTFFGRQLNRLSKEGFGFSGFKEFLFSGFVKPIKSAVAQAKKSIQEGNIRAGFDNIFSSFSKGAKIATSGFMSFGKSVVKSIADMSKAFLSSPMIIAFLSGAAFSALGTSISEVSKSGDALKGIATFLKEILYNILGIFGLDRSQLSWIEDIFDGITQGIRDIFDWISIELDRILPGRQGFFELSERINLGTQIVTQDPAERRAQLDSQLASDYDLLSEYQKKYADLQFQTVSRGEGQSPELLFSSIGFDVSEQDLAVLNGVLQRINDANAEITTITAQTNAGLREMTKTEQIDKIGDYFEEIANMTKYGTEQTEVLRNRRDSIMVSFEELVAATAGEYEDGLAGYFASLIGTDEEWRIAAVTSTLEGAGMVDAVAQLLGRDSVAFGYLFNAMGKQNQRKYVNDYLNGAFRVDLQNTDVPDEILAISQDLQSRLRDGLIDDEFYGQLSDELVMRLEEIYADQLTASRQLTAGLTEGAVIESFANELATLEQVKSEFESLGGGNMKLQSEFDRQLLETAASIDIKNQDQINTFNTFIDSIESLDETEKAFYKTLAITNRDFVKGLFPDVETVKETRQQEEAIDTARNSYENIIALAKELESGAISADNIGEFVEKLMLLGGADEANTEAYGVVLEQLRALEEAGVLTEGTANAVDNYVRLVRQGRESLEGLGLSQDEYNAKLAEYLRLMGAIDKQGNIVLPAPVTATGGATTDEATQEMQTRLQELETEFNTEIADFDKEYLEKEKERQQELLDLEADYRKSEAETVEDYNISRKRALEDHLREMKSIGDNDFKDAVANRNAAQAIEAMQRQKETKEQFDLDEKRAQQDFMLESQRRMTEYNNKVAKIREQIGLDFHQYHVERQAKISAFQQRLKDEGLFDLHIRNMQQRRLQELATFAEKLASPFVSVAQRAVNLVNGIMATLNPIGPKTKAESGAPATFTSTGNPPSWLKPIVIPPPTGNNALTGNNPFSTKRRQSGGMAYEGKRYSIIEDGKPEIFTPGKSGRITSFSQLQNLIGGRNPVGASMGGNTTIEINLSGMQFNGMGNSDEIIRRVENEVVPKITRAIISARR